MSAAAVEPSSSTPGTESTTPDVTLFARLPSWLRLENRDELVRRVVELRTTDPRARLIAFILLANFPKMQRHSLERFRRNLEAVLFTLPTGVELQPPDQVEQSVVAAVKRPLTREEVDGITRRMVARISPIHRIQEFVLAAERRLVAEQLADQPVAVANLPRLQALILERFQRAIAPPGEAVGTIAGQATIAPLSQVNLDGKGNTGIIRSQESEARLEEVYNLNKKRRVAITRIHFQNKSLSWDQVYDLHRTYEELSVSDVIDVNNPDIEPWDTFYDELVESGNRLPTWFNLSRRIHLCSDRNLVVRLPGNRPDPLGQHFTDPSPLASHVMRLQVDAEKLFRYRISMRQLARTIEDNINDESTILVRCIYSGYEQGTIFVFCFLDAISSSYTDILFVENRDRIGEIFFNIQLGKMQGPTFRISGIENLRSYRPQEIKLVGMINHARALPLQAQDPVARRDEPRRWVLTLDAVGFRTQGAPVQNLIYLLRRLGFSVVVDRVQEQAGIREVPRIERLVLTTPHPVYPFIRTVEISHPTLRDDDVLKWIRQQIGAAERAVRQYSAYQVELAIRQSNAIMHRARLQPIDPRKIAEPPSAAALSIFDASRYVYAEVLGTSTLKLLRRPEIDPRYTHSNIFTEIESLLDIEALRTYIVREISSTFEREGMYLYPGHTLLIANHMSLPGTGTPFTHTGSINAPGGQLQRAAEERPLQPIRRGATLALADPTTSVASAIYVGSTIQTGSNIASVDLASQAVTIDRAELDALRAGRTVAPATIPTATSETLDLARADPPRNEYNYRAQIELGTFQEPPLRPPTGSTARLEQVRIRDRATLEELASPNLLNIVQSVSVPVREVTAPIGTRIATSTPAVVARTVSRVLDRNVPPEPRDEGLGLPPLLQALFK